MKKYLWLALSAPLLASAILVWSLGGLSSCVKSLESKKPDLGPEVQSSQVVAALDEALSLVTPASIAEGQTVQYEVNYKVLGTDTVKKFYEQTYEVTRLEDTPESLKVYFVRTIVDFSQFPPVSDRRDFIDEFKKQVSGSEVMKAARANQELLAAEFKSGVQAQAAERKPERYSYHNLVFRRNLVTDPPSDVSSKPGCGDVPNCTLRYHYIEYDEVAWYNDEEFKKTRYQLEITGDTPYYGFFISNCSIYPVTSYRVRACQVLRNFSYK